MDTIFALATPHGKSGIAIIRISGPESFRISSILTRSSPAFGKFQYTSFFDKDGLVFDKGLVLAFKAPSSFTGEDVVEFHVHGSLAIITKMENLIYETSYARPAKNGEFTRRALTNGCINLIQVEALGDLLEAETELQLKQAQITLNGNLHAFIHDLRTKILTVSALLEANIDFADEDIPEHLLPNVSKELQDILSVIKQQIIGSYVNERIKTGFEVALIGPPNSGKSTLLNYIAGRDVAITSNVSGTTRDIIEIQTDLWGMSVTFLDTAGLRKTDDTIESIGINRAVSRAKSADLRIFLQDKGHPLPFLNPKKDDLILTPKIDLISASDGVSGLTGQGVDTMLHTVHQTLTRRLSSSYVATHARHRMALQSAEKTLSEALSLTSVSSPEIEIIAHYVRNSVIYLDELIGTVGVEDVLGEIFSRFCIGK